MFSSARESTGAPVVNASDSRRISSSRRGPCLSLSLGMSIAYPSGSRVTHPREQGRSDVDSATPMSDHVRSLRERVGHDLLLLPSVAVLVQDDHGRVLLVRQAH